MKQSSSPERRHPAGLPLLVATVLGLLGAGRSAAPAPPHGQAEAANVVPLTVRTPRGGFNRMVVSVTVCAPGTARCATIDDVMVDTGSTGLRLEASAVPSWLRLPAFTGAAGRPLAECLRFVHDQAWGPLVRADFRIGGMAVADLPLQIIDDQGRAEPEACPPSHVRPTANGTLGVGQHLSDCGGDCRQSPTSPLYFDCEVGRCTPRRGPVSPAERVPNPVARMAVHDNGIVVDLPAAAPGGTREVVGTLTFGVGTADDNRLGPARIVRLDALGRFTTLYGGRAYTESIIDSGTETDVFADDRLPTCTGMAWAFCAAPDRRREAVLVGRDGARVAMPFVVGNYRAIRERNAGASDSAAVAADPSATSFIWGAPLFFGKRVFLVMDGRPVPGREGETGPFYAIEDRRSAEGSVAVPRAVAARLGSQSQL